MLKKELPDLRTYEFEEVAFNQLMQNRIYTVLIVCSNYDYYMLEEDGRIDERIFNEYSSLHLRYPPSFVHANSARRAIRMLESDNIDLVITWLDVGNYKAFDTSKQIKEAFPDAKVEWYWINEAWEGVKIGLDIFTDIKPKPNQRRRLDNPYFCRLGYTGFIYEATKV